MRPFEPPICPGNAQHLTRHQLTLLRGYIEAAIDRQPASVRDELRRRMFGGELKVTSLLEPVVRDGLQRLTLFYLVETPAADGRAIPVAKIHSSRLFLTTAQLDEELRTSAYLNGLVIPDDLSSLDGA